ncbi:tail fiber protein [Enterobacter kobei]|uniref:tail fiber protein n=1 Tax=Enterobacter kobei TaxID=208224 RepID=UPI003CE96A19
MQKIGSSTNTADAKGEFTNGDPQTQVPCTWVTAAWLNTLQRELIHLCEETGISIDPHDDTQIYQAIAQLLKTGTEGMVKSVNTHKPDASGNVKLGSAADADIVTSMTDTTAGRVPVAGWMGTGGPEIPIVDGTDIYKYFATAASGNYGGGSGLINAATTGGWVGFKWQQHGAGNKYGFLLEQASSGQMALHIYNNPNGDMANPEKYWSNSGLFFKESGGTITGKLRINVDGEALRLQPKTAGYASYILSADSANANHWYVGAGSVGNADVAFNNYKGGNNSVVLKSDGTIYLNPTQGRSAIVNSPLQLGTTKKLTIESQNTSTLGAILHLWGNADRPTVIEFGDDTSYHFYSQRNKDGSISFVSPGEVVPGNYTNFDSRYLTKSENLPVGIPLPWPTATPPSGWLICNGSAFNKTSCPKLAAVYPSGNLPDLRAQFIRGLDNGKNIDTGRAILSTQAGQSPYSSVGSTYGNTSWNSRATVKTGYYMTTGTDNDGTYQIMSESQAQRETRPTNVAFNYIVRAA